MPPSTRAAAPARTRRRAPSSAIASLRRRAIAHSLFEPTTLARAVERLAFVQADPIRAPARAQDLILRQRVHGYRANDLERRYPELGLEEDMLYAYGFVTPSLHRLLYPRPPRRMTALERRILDGIRDGGPVHPRDVEARFGTGRVVNAWGGHSRATKHALERLHRMGHLRIARRDAGIRVYQAAPPRVADDVAPAERLRDLVLQVANLLAPVPERTLATLAAWLRRSIPSAPPSRATLRELRASGALEGIDVDGDAFLWPAGTTPAREAPATVRFLAPFDPLVWDRRRFERLWGWAYRFEAYTPPPKRVRGYYAMPLLFGDAVIGWANAAVDERGALQVELGYEGARPRDPVLRREADAEIARLEAFLRPER